MDRRQLWTQIKKQASELEVVQKLSMFGMAVQNVTQAAETSDYCLLVLKPDEKVIQITGYDRRNLKEATDHYLEEEKNCRILGSTKSF